MPLAKGAVYRFRILSRRASARDSGQDGEFTAFCRRMTSTSGGRTDEALENAAIITARKKTAKRSMCLRNITYSLTAQSDGLFHDSSVE